MRGSEPEAVWTGLETLQDAAARVAKSDVTVLITGETGVGKEVLARWIHQRSPRSQRDFLPVNIASRSSELIASDLFGHEQGAFTGAIKARPGCFRACRGGTVFLDEIGDLQLEHQQRLLRVLQNGEVQPVGSDRPEHVDARVIAATNVDLVQKVKGGGFREDLYYRLNVVRLHVPPLRQRRQAIPEIAASLLTERKRNGQTVARALAADAISWLQARPWPGNVRELDNLMQRAVVFLDGPNISAEDLSSLCSDDERAAHAGDEQERRIQDELLPLIETLAPAASPERRRSAARVAGWLQGHLLELETAHLGEAVGAPLLQGLAIDQGNPLLEDLALALSSVIALDLRHGNEDEAKAQRLIERWGESLGKSRSRLGPLRLKIRQHLAVIGIGTGIPKRPIY